MFTFLKKFGDDIFTDIDGFFSSKRTIGIISFLILIVMTAGNWVGAHFDMALIMAFKEITMVALVAIAIERVGGIWMNKPTTPPPPSTTVNTPSEPTNITNRGS